MRQVPMQLCGCFMLLLSVAWAGLVEEQTYGIERAPSLVYNGHRLRCFQHGENRIIQPYIALRIGAISRVRRSPMGDGFYFLVPLEINSKILLPPAETKWHVLDVKRFKVELRDHPCPTKCPSVTVSAEWRQNDAPHVRFRCDNFHTCRGVLQSLHYNGERSRSLRSALRFTFYGTVNSNQYAMSRVGLPVANAVTRPFEHEFWFEGDKLMLFTIKSNIGLSAFDTFQSQQSYPIPRDGSLPAVYRSNLLEKLSAVASTAKFEIVAEMRKGKKAVAQAVFSADPAGLDKNSWFSAERLLSTKPFWVGRSGFNFFSISGDASSSVQRRFFINRNYGGCPADVGLFTVSDIRDPCQWGFQFFQTRAPTLIYSAYDGVPYQSGSAQSADNFLVYLRLARPPATAAPALPGAYYFEKNRILLFSINAAANSEAANTFLNSAIKHSVPTGGLPALYRSELIDSLDTAFANTGMKTIVVEMRAGDRMVSQVVFDISVRRSQLNKENWFARDRVVSSYPYWVGDSFNYFSIRGHADYKRSWFISFSYGGCPGDRAFWLVSDARDPCTWANSKWVNSPALIYSANRDQTLEGGAARYDANRFLVYLA